MLSVDSTGRERVFGRPRPGKDVRSTLIMLKVIATNC